MKEKIQNWLEFHSSVLEKFPKPFYAFIISCVFTVFCSAIYPLVISKIAFFNVFGHYPYQDFIIKHANLFGIGMWLVPLTIFLILSLCCVGLHLSNIKRAYN